MPDTETEYVLWGQKAAHGPDPIKITGGTAAHCEAASRSREAEGGWTLEIKPKAEPTPEQRAAANPAPVAESDYAAASEDNTGFCIVCRAFTTGCCEPDARQYQCEQCGGMTVYGAEECLVHGFITFTD